MEIVIKELNKLIWPYYGKLILHKIYPEQMKVTPGSYSCNFVIEDPYDILQNDKALSEKIKKQINRKLKNKWFTLEDGAELQITIH